MEDKNERIFLNLLDLSDCWGFCIVVYRAVAVCLAFSAKSKVVEGKRPNRPSQNSEILGFRADDWGQQQWRRQ
jgi:hypothetical protein